MTDPGVKPERPTAGLREVAGLFLRLGATAFGGPAAHVALMRDEVVGRRGWLTDKEFLDLVSATNLIPGPNSTELAIHIGHRVAGWRGLLTAGACFIAPAALIVTGIAWAYVAFGALPQVGGILYGVKSVVIAVVLQALWSLGRTCLKNWPLAAVGAADLLLAALGVHELLVLFGTGVVLAVGRPIRGRRPTALLGLAAPSFATPQVAAAVGSMSFGLWPLFWVFVKTGAVLFGSGYVLLAFLRSDLVERYGWLTEQQLLDAVAVGQVTPGPVFTTATFVGYVLGGPAGAAVATVGIFLPAFVFVAASIPVLARLRRSAAASGFLDGVNVASLALMAVVTAQLARAALVDAGTVVLAVASGVLLVRYRVNSTWLIAGGAAWGLVRVYLGAP
jgi:chromate transporter